MAAATQVADATGPPRKKQPRLNPARRNSAKAQEQSQTEPAVTVAKTGSDNVAEPQLDAAPGTKTNSPSSAATTQTVISKQTTSKTSQKPHKSTTPGSTPHDTNAGNNASALALTGPSFVTGSLLGCAAGAPVLLGSGLLKNAVGVDSAVLAARSAKAVINNLIDDTITSMKAGIYSSVDALDMLRRTTLAYATMVPGGTPFVERMFRKVEMVRKQRGHEVNKVAADATSELSTASKRGAGDTELQSIILSNLVKLSRFARTATQISLLAILD